MIIDATSTIKNILYTSNNFDICPTKVRVAEYSFTTEDMIFQISKDTVKECYITIDFTRNVNFKSLDCKFTSDTVPYVKCYYSFDNNIFDEFPYITYELIGIVPNEQDYLILKKYVGSILHVKKLNKGHRHYSLFNTSTGKLEVIPMKDNDSLVNHLDDAIINTESPINIKYIWTYQNASHETVYLYNKEIRFFKAVFTKFNASSIVPFKIYSFSVYADQTIDSVKLNDISMLNNNFFKQKYFETYDFVPTLAKSFFEMLSYSDKEIDKVVPDISVDFALDNIDHTFHLLSPLALNIDKYHDASLMIKVVIDDRFYTFSYTTIPDIFTDINPIINRVLSDSSAYTYMDISVLVHTNTFDIVKQRKYYAPFTDYTDGWLLVNQVGEMTIGEDFYVG
jgi:hypothetical protein